MEQSIKSNQIPTAEEFYEQWDENFEKLSPEFCFEMMIKFAQLHVQEALNAADGEVPLPYSHGVLNCYPLSNIK
jgi:hypothetical protein